MTSDAEKELSRIERELDAKDQPLGKPPMKQGGWVGTNDEKPKNQSLDAIVVGALLLLGIGAQVAKSPWLHLGIDCGVIDFMFISSPIQSASVTRRHISC